jgi:hypothetical protein
MYCLLTRRYSSLTNSSTSSQTNTHVPLSLVAFQKLSLPKAIFPFPFMMNPIRESFKFQVYSSINCVESNAKSGFAADVESKRKTVRFASEPQVMNCVDELREISDQDRSCTWLQRDEYELSRASNRSQCRKMSLTGGSAGGLLAAYSAASCVAASEIDSHEVHSTQVYTPNEV